MKNIFYALLIFGTISYGQNKESYENYFIEYNTIINSEKRLTKTGTLILNNNYLKSFFYEKKEKEKEQNRVEKKELKLILLLYQKNKVKSK